MARQYVTSDELQTGGDRADRRREMLDRDTFRLGPRDEAWHNVGAAGEPAFMNSWGNPVSDTPPCRFKRIGNVVYLEVHVTGGAGGTTIFVLPAGYRPSHKLYIVGRSSIPGAATGLIDAGGAVFTETATAVQFVVSFPADQ